MEVSGWLAARPVHFNPAKEPPPLPIGQDAGSALSGNRKIAPLFVSHVAQPVPWSLYRLSCRTHAERLETRTT
jgi:hypothetical protein